MKAKGTPRILLLGSGELGKEFVISAQRLGAIVMAVDRYAGAPAMHVADESQVIDMLDGQELERIVDSFKPDLIVPEIEAIRTEVLSEFEARGMRVVPNAFTVQTTMNRDAIRDLAANELGLKTARFSYARSLDDLEKSSAKVGFPNVVKPVMSSSGKGQSLVKSESQVAAAWKYAVEQMRGDKPMVIVEEFIDFDFEITLLTVKPLRGPTVFFEPIGHRQERGDYQESWLPARMTSAQLKKAQKMAKRVTDRLGGAGLYGVEFFVKGSQVYFSELSPRPHDTGMVTLISHRWSEFDIHLRAILGLPLPELKALKPSASAVILAQNGSPTYKVEGVERALKVPTVDVRLFGKPETRKYRRMGVALAMGKSVNEARARARKAAGQVKVVSSTLEGGSQ